jgi:hypothetical protein
VDAHPPSGAGKSNEKLRSVLQGFDVSVVVRRMEAGFDLLPAYTRFSWPVDRGAVIRWNVDLSLTWMTSGTAPSPWPMPG